jgi:small subunit ribosomal protein S1
VNRKSTSPTKKSAETLPHKVAKKTSSRILKEPETMAELLSGANYNLKVFKPGDVVEGVVIEKTKRIIYLDIGGKSEGLVLDREIKAAADFVNQLQVGDKVQAIVTQAENEKGQTLLSLKQAAASAIWEEFEERIKTGEVVSVTGKETNRGGLVVTVRGLQGFIPASQFGSKYATQIDDLINRQIEVKIIEVDREKNRLIFSEKEVSEAGVLKAQEEALKKVKIGDVFEGKVTGVMPFGLFVKVEVPAEKKAKEGRPLTLEGLVHISEISWEKVENAADYYKEGDKVKVQVLSIDKKSGKLGLSIKRLTTDPWVEIEKKYPVEAAVKGEVIRLAPFGAFVRLAPGVEALIHISKIPTDKTLKVGKKVECFVESVDKEARKMSLGLMLKEKPVGYK